MTCLRSTILLSASVKVAPHVKAIWAAGLICLTIVSVLPDFAVSPASTIASHIKVTTVLLHCVSSAASCRKLFNSWGTLLSHPLCCALLCCLDRCIKLDDAHVKVSDPVLVLRTKQNTIQPYCGSSLLQSGGIIPYQTPHRPAHPDAEPDPTHQGFELSLLLGTDPWEAGENSATQGRAPHTNFKPVHIKGGVHIQEPPPQMLRGSNTCGFHAL